ncbi:MAG TPA: hypothetical protein VF816_10080 [Rhodocyclaceae bacterium]
MRGLRNHPLIALLCALCLLGAQWAAHAHYASHLASGTVAFHATGSADEAPAIERICQTCAAYAALASAPPSHPIIPGVVRLAAQAPLAAAPIFVPAPGAPPYASRAPPDVL